MKIVLPLFLTLAISFMAQGQMFELSDEWPQLHYNGRVFAMAKDTSRNTLYLGGDFSTIAFNKRYGAIVDSANGDLSGSIGDPNNYVLASIPDNYGGWFIAGEFTAIGDSTRHHLAHIDQTGQLSAWKVYVNGRVNTLHLKDSILYIGGNMTTVGSQPRSGMAAINVLNRSVLPWNPNITGEVKAMAFHGKQVYIGGDFSMVNGVGRNHFVKLDSNLSLVGGWIPNPNNPITTLNLTDSTLYVGGEFTSISQTTKFFLAAYDVSNNSLKSWNPHPNGEIMSIEVLGDKVLLGGHFGMIGTQSKFHLAAVKKSDGSLLPWSPNADDDVRDMWFDGSKLYVAGEFDSIGGQGRGGVALLDTGTGLAEPWNPNPDTHVYTISKSGGGFFIGGVFHQLNIRHRNNVAAINTNRRTIRAWNPDVNGDVSDLLVDGNKIYIAGEFSQVGGTLRNNLAAVFPSGNLFSGLNPGFDDEVYTMAISGNELYVGGYFDKVGTTDRQNLALIDKNSGWIYPWDPDPNGWINSIEISDSTVYVGGRFTTLGTTNKNMLAAFDQATGALLPWNPNPDWYIADLKSTDSLLYVSGNFEYIDGQVRNGLASFQKSNGTLTSWDPRPFTTHINIPYINTMMLMDTLMVFGGHFVGVGQDSVSSVAAISLKTGNLMPWDAQLNSTVLALESSGDALFVGGVFNQVAGVSSGGFQVFGKCQEKFVDYQSHCNSFTWVNGQTYYSSGIDEYTLTGASGCDSVLLLELSIHPLDTSVTSQNATLIANDSNASYQWLNCGTMQPIPGATSQSFTPTANGHYAVIVTTANCMDTSACYAITDIGVDEWNHSPISIYPNPNKGSFSIELEGESLTGEIEVYTISGQQIYQEHVESKSQIQIELKLAAGVYLLKFNGLGKSFYQRLVIQ